MAMLEERSFRSNSSRMQFACFARAAIMATEGDTMQGGASSPAMRSSKRAKLVRDGMNAMVGVAAPGQFTRHYATRTPMTVLAAPEDRPVLHGQERTGLLAMTNPLVRFAHFVLTC